MEFVEANWLLILIALIVAITIAWFVFHSARRTRVLGEEPRDVLDDGAAPAARNQALIDAPPAASAVPLVPSAPAGLAGMGEAVAAAAAPVPAPTPAPAPAPEPASGAGDDLTRIKGVGPRLAAQLGDMGITRFAQIAGWSEADIDRIDAQLGRFQGRIRRDSWVDQAGLLAAGDTAGFAERYGNLS